MKTECLISHVSYLMSHQMTHCHDQVTGNDVFLALRR